MCRADLIVRIKEALTFAASGGGAAGISAGVLGVIKLHITPNTPLILDCKLKEEKANMWTIAVSCHRGMLLRGNTEGGQTWERGGNVASSAALRRRAQKEFKGFRVVGGYLDPEIVEVAAAAIEQPAAIEVAQELVADGMAALNIQNLAEFAL